MLVPKFQPHDKPAQRKLAKMRRRLTRRIKSGNAVLKGGAAKRWAWLIAEIVK